MSCKLTLSSRCWLCARESSNPLANRRKCGECLKIRTTKRERGRKSKHHIEAEIRSLKLGKLTILRHKRIIWSTEIDKPVPVLSLLQQKSNSVQHTSNHGRSLRSHQISFSNHHHIVYLLEILREINSLCIRSFQIQMQQVIISRMIHRPEQPVQTNTIASCTGDEVSKPRNLRQVIGCVGDWIGNGVGVWKGFGNWMWGWS